MQAHPPSTVVTTKDQDPLITHTPLIGVDVWEHAYYRECFTRSPSGTAADPPTVQYQNLRPKYLEAIWSVINFSEAEKRLTEAQKKAQL